MKNKALLIALVSLLVLTPGALAANNNGNNGNSNGNANSASKSNSNSNNNGNNNNNNANSAGNNGTAARNSGGQSASASQGKSQSNSSNNSNNNGSVNSRSNSDNNQSNNNQNNSSQDLRIGGPSTFSITSGETITFGDNDANSVEVTDEDFDEDMDDGTTFRLSGIVEDLDTDNDTFAIGGKTFAIEDNQMDFLTSQGILSNGVKVQVNGNNSNNGNIVRIMKIMGPDGQMLMVRLHVNDQVSQFSVKSKNVGGADEDGFLSQITSFFQSFLGIDESDDEDGDEDISPTPSVSPSPTPEVSPTP